MRRLLGLALVGFTVSFGSGCASMSNTAKGAGIGAGVGAASGALIGNAANGKAGKGALIGGAIGALAGGIIGNEEDQREKAEKDAQLREAEHRAANASQGSPMGIADVIQLTRDGTPENVIINQMRSTQSTFQLSTEDIRLLQSNNVAANVIVEMQNRRPDTVQPVRHRGPRVYAPPPPPEPVYIYQRPVYVVPPPPPPPGFAVGVRINH